MTFRMSARSGEAFGATRRLDDFDALPLPLLPCSSCLFLRSSLAGHPRLRGWGAGQRQQVIGEHSQSHPTFHPGRAAIAAAGEPVPSLQSTDTPFASRAPAQRPPKPALLLMRPPGRRQAPPPRQSYVFDLARGGRLLVRRRGKSRIRCDQARCATKQLLVTLQAGFPEVSVGHALGTDLIIDDELRLVLLDLHQLAELVGLHLLLLAN